MNNPNWTVCTYRAKCTPPADFDRGGVHLFVNDVVIGPDGLWMAVATDAVVRVFSTFERTPYKRNGYVLKELHGHTDDVRALAVSPCGTFIATASDDKTSRIFNVQTGICFLILPTHPAKVTCVAFSKTGTKLITGCDDGKLRAFNPITGDKLWSLQVTNPGFRPFLSVLFTNDQTRFVVVTHNNISVYALDGGESSEIGDVYG
jgi:WD40 repeat protein